MQEVHHPGEQALLLHRLIRLQVSAATGLGAGISGGLLSAFPDQDPDQVEDALSVLWCRDPGLVFEDVLHHHCRSRPLGWVRLRVEQRKVVRKGQDGKQGHV